MNFTVIGIIVVLIFAAMGAHRGLLRILSFIGSLLVASLLASPLADVFIPVAAAMSFIPRVFVPLGALLLAGLCVFCVVSMVSSWLLTWRERGREAEKLPRITFAERIGGALVGAAWGFGIVMLMFTGLHFLGSVEKAIARASESAQPAQVEEPRTSSPQTAAPASTGRYTGISQKIDESAFGSFVGVVAPLEEKIARIFTNLALVTGDPVRFERFQSHPVIKRLTQNPKLQAVSNDEEIQSLLRNQSYRILLDHPKVVALLEDQNLVTECRKVDIDAILAEIIAEPPPRADPALTPQPAAPAPQPATPAKPARPKVY